LSSRGTRLSVVAPVILALLAPWPLGMPTAVAPASALPTDAQLSEAVDGAPMPAILPTRESRAAGKAVDARDFGGGVAAWFTGCMPAGPDAPGTPAGVPTPIWQVDASLLALHCQLTV